MRTRLNISVVLVGVLLMSLQACASAENSSGVSSGRVYADYDIDDIVASYEHDIDDFRGLVKTELGQRALDDGWISDQELAEIRSQFQTCLADYGVGDVKFYSDGSYQIENYDAFLAEWELNHPDQGDELRDPESVCAVESDEEVVEAAFVLMRTNPLNEDFEAMMLDCLKRNGVVEPGVSGANLQFDELEGQGNADAVDACIRDPMGLLPQASEVAVP